MQKSKSYHEKVSRARAQKKADKRAQSKSAHRHTETPRGNRQRATQTPTLLSALGFKNKFTAALLRARAA